MSKTTRGVAASNRQLSKLQKHMLLWIYFWDVEILRTYVHEMSELRGAPLQKLIEEERSAFEREGVPWSSKGFYGATPTNAQAAALSRALHRLEARGLVTLYNASTSPDQKLIHTQRVKLTRLGKKTAANLYLSQKRE